MGHVQECVNFDDYFHSLLSALHTIGVNVTLRWPAQKAVEVTLAIPAFGLVVTDSFDAGIADASKWIEAVVCELLPMSLFALRRRPEYKSPYVPGSDDARAVGCICDSGQVESEFGYVTKPRCPEHGFASRRYINGKLVKVGDHWHPGDPVREKD